MKIRFYCDSGANIHSCREDILDLEKDLGMTVEDWNNTPEEGREEMVHEWANDRLEIGYEIIEEDEK